MQKGFAPLFILVGILILGVVGSGAYYLGKSATTKSNSTVVQVSQPTAVSQATPAPDETAEWKTYRNDKYGFEIKYPNDWNHLKEYDSEILPGEHYLVGIQQTQGIGPYTLSINVIDNASNLTADEYVNEVVVPKVIDYLESFNDPQSKQAITQIKNQFIKLGSISGVIVYGLPNAGNGAEAFYLTHNGYIYVLTRIYGTTTRDDGGNNEDKEFKQILSTFKFLP